jgi:tetratricopeptide (TPR) repeat protein/glycosyltransferase involved in cell wall biosynthesis
MYTLVAFATKWGSKHGGINSFNTEFISRFGHIYQESVQTVCIVDQISQEVIDEVFKASRVRLVPLPYIPQATTFGLEQGKVGVNELKNLGINFTPDKTVWLGHDRITGEAAIVAAEISGGRSAVIHHMSYDHYEPYAENSQSAHKKTQIQTRLFQKADTVLAVGPLLRDAATDRLGGSKTVHMLIPALPEIDSQKAPNTFMAFLSGRLSDDAARIKQGHLGIAAFATAQREARKPGLPDAFRNQPKLLLRGVDFEGRIKDSALSNHQDQENELRQFASEYSGAVCNIHALSYTEDQQQLYKELSGASVAMMPSWHEGFGLVAWEAIAAGVPLIISRNSGVYHFLDEKYTGMGTGCVFPIEVLGKEEHPYFQVSDLEATVRALMQVAKDPSLARKKAANLRDLLLGKETWLACAEQVANAFGWELKKNSLLTTPPESIAPSLPAVSVTTDQENKILLMPTLQWQPGMAISQLLRAEKALLPFDEVRQPDVDVLNNWLDDEKWPQSIRLITGPGGQGKTRLARELCNKRIESGWIAGFLDSSLAPNKMAASWQTLHNLNKPLLIVIDYVETRQTAFLDLLKASIQKPSAQAVRMLLLARDGGEWWENLSSKDPQCEGLLSGYATTGPFQLPSLYTAEQDRKEAYKTAIQTFAQTLDVKPPATVPDLLGEHFNRPLYVQMAALSALYGENPTTAQGLTRALLNHERRYWSGVLSQFNWSEPEGRAEQLLALATLAGGFTTQRDAWQFWGKAKYKDFNSGDFSSLFRELSTLYPGAQGIQALRPDLLGEALVAQALLRSDGDHLLDAVLTRSSNQTVRRNVLTVIARLSTQRLDLKEILVDALSRHFHYCYNDIVAVSTETTSLLPSLAEEAFERLTPGNKSQVAGSLAPLLSVESVQLANLSCLVSESEARKAYDKLNKKPSDKERIYDFAKAMSTYATKLARVGQSQQACAVCLESLENYRQLTPRDVKNFEPNYAMSLNNYANRLGDIGKNDEALEFAQQALEIHKRLAEKTPDRFEPKYAMSLSNCANRLGDIGKNDEALEFAQQALEIHKRLAEKTPDRFEPNYAMSLSNYANHLGDIGKNDEALEFAQQALEIHKRLAEKTPDRFEPNYATSLSNYAGHLSAIGKNDEALEFAQQSLEIYKRLAEKTPDRFEPDYAMSLSNCASHLSAIGKDDEALEFAQQSLEIYKRLAEKTPDRFEPDYAMSLSNYASHLSDIGKNDEALEFAQQALEIYKRLAEKTPDRFEPNYATSLSNYASHLSDIGKDDEALEFAQQALEIRKRLAEKAPDRFEPNYAMSLSNCAGHLSAIGKNDGAFEFAQQALEIHKRLAEKTPDRFEPDYATSLSNYANRLGDIGKNDEALEFAQQALEIHKRLVEKTPDRFAHSLVDNICLAHFLYWLRDQTTHSNIPERNQIMSNVPLHRRFLCSLYLVFVEACSTAEQSFRTNAFLQVLSIWTDLSISDQNASLPYWLCATAWCAKYQPTDLIDTSWKTRWDQFVKQRNDSIPQWMLAVARHFDFQFPE